MTDPTQRSAGGETAALTYEAVRLPFISTTDGHDAALTVIGEQVAPGLAIVPMIGADENGRVFYLGGFQLNHVPSGLGLSTHQVVTCLGCIERYAKTLAALDIDWSQDSDQLTTQLKASQELTSAIGEASIELLMCDEAECAVSCERGDEPAEEAGR